MSRFVLTQHARPKSDWVGFVCFSVWTLINATLAAGVYRRTPLVAAFLAPTFAHEALVAVSFLARRPLIRQAEGWAPQAVAYAASFMMPAFCFFCGRWQPQWIQTSGPALFVPGIILWLIGAYLGLWSLVRLRRAFSIVPQARTLVTDGPYRVARHPVYASYLLQYGGVALSHLTPPIALLFIAWFAAVMARISYEERVLAAAFPEYAQYRREVGRFGPRLAAIFRSRRWSWKPGSAVVTPDARPSSEARERRKVGAGARV